MLKTTSRKLLLLMALTALLVLAVGVGCASAVTYTDDLCTDPSKAISSSNYSGRIASRAFDNCNTEFTVDAWEAASSPAPHWLGYDFVNSVAITKYTISQAQYNTPKTWSFQGSNDNTNWVDLQTVENAPGWTLHEKREYVFDNPNSYRYYRILVTAIYQTTNNTIIGEMEMMADAKPLPSAPTDLSASVSNNNATLTWTAVTDATSYNIKRATVDGGPYETIGTATTAEISYEDLDLNPGTYYYVVTSVNANGESGNSNQVVVIIPGADPTNGTLAVTMANGDDRTYNLTMAQIEAFIDWYGNRSTGGTIYIIDKGASGAYTSIKDYLVFDKIVAWQVMEY